MLRAALPYTRAVHSKPHGGRTGGVFSYRHAATHGPRVTVLGEQNMLSAPITIVNWCELTEHNIAFLHTVCAVQSTSSSSCAWPCLVRLARASSATVLPGSAE